MSNTAAHDSLVIAKAYYDRLLRPNLTTTEHLDCIKFGTHHLALARHADPYATLTVQEKSGAVTYTQEDLSSGLLYFQAMHEQAHEDEEGCEKSLETLKQATAYTPRAPFLHRSIAKTFLKLDRRDEAITAAQFALALDPSSMDSRILLDKIEATPSLGVPEEIPGESTQQLGCGLMIAAVLGFFTIPSLIAQAMPGHTKNWPIVFTVVGLGVLFFIGMKMREWGEGSTYLHKHAQRDRYRE